MDLRDHQKNANKFYHESWKILNAVEKRYYPKLQPILELLNIFMKNATQEFIDLDNFIKTTTINKF